MVLLIHKLWHHHHHHNHRDNHHHNHNHNHHRRRQDDEEWLSSCLQSFYSNISNSLAQLFPNSEKSCFHRCCEVIPIIRNEFERLIVSIHYPMSDWDNSLVEMYLNSTLNLMEFLNSISSSISHMGHTCLSLSHYLSHRENMSHSLLEKIRVKGVSKNSKNGVREIGEGNDRVWLGKERVVHHALMVMNEVGIWACRIVLFGLCGDDDDDHSAYIETRKLAKGFVNSSIFEDIMDPISLVTEVTEMNDALDDLVSALRTENRCCNEAKEFLKTRLKEFETKLEGLGKVVDCLFSEVLAGRKEVINSIRTRK